MTLYLVSKLSQEKDIDGTILVVNVTVSGVFNSAEHAQQIAEKHGGAVDELIVDKEVPYGQTVQYWINPGFYVE